MNKFQIGLIVSCLLLVGLVLGCTSEQNNNVNLVNSNSSNAASNNAVSGCTTDWQCGAWSDCSSSGTQTRTCLDANACSVISNKPSESQSCTAPASKSATISYKASIKDSISYSIGNYRYTAEPDAGKVFLQIDMVIKNNGYKKFNTNPFYFNLILNSISYDYSSNTYNLDNKLDSVDILNGGTLIGALLFEVPGSATSAPISMSYDGYCDGFDKCTVVWSQQ